jgi:hypothetical protein
MAETLPEQDPQQNDPPPPSDAPPKKPPENGNGDHPNHCPDPSPPYIEYQVAAAVVKEKSVLYEADVAVVGPRYDKLAGAQDRYSTAWAAQKDKWKDVRSRLKCLQDQLECDLDRDVINDLVCCWEDLQEDDDSADTSVDCTTTDGKECGDLPDKIGELRELLQSAEACAAQADNDFDDVAGLPDQLSQLLGDLLQKLTELEQYHAGPDADPRRSFVRYLALYTTYAGLKAKLTTAAEHACKLKRLFVLLLARHRKVICIKIAIHRYEEDKALRDAAKQNSADSLVDRVLECLSSTPDDGDGNGHGDDCHEPSVPQCEQDSSTAKGEDLPATQAPTAE